MKDSKSYFKFSGIIVVILVTIFLLFKDDTQNDYTSFLVSKKSLRKPIAESTQKFSDKNILSESLDNSSQSSEGDRKPAQTRRTIKPKPINSARSQQRVSAPDYPDSEFDREIDGLTLKHNLHAVEKDSINPADYKIIDEKLGYYIIESEHTTPVESLSVVKVEGSNSWAIFTGVLKIKFEDLEDGQLAVANFPAEINQEYAHLNRLLIKFSSFDQTMNALKELKEDPNVIEVDVELLQYQREAK